MVSRSGCRLAFICQRETTLKDVRDRLEREYGFRASERMYKSRLKAWGYLKNAKKDDWAALATIQRRRKELGKRATVFTVRGRQRSVKDLQKYIRSLSMTDDEFLASHGPNVEIPSYIRAYTPEVDGEMQELEIERTDQASTATRVPPQSCAAHQHGSASISTPGDERDSKHSPSGSSTLEYSTPSPGPLTATGLSLNTSSVRHGYSIFSERSPNTATTIESDILEPAYSTPCDQLQRDIEAIGYQMISPAPLPSRYGSEDIENWMLVNAHTPQSSSPGTPDFEFTCSRCHQPSSHHFASLDTFAPPQPRRPTSQPYSTPPVPRVRSILNDTSSPSFSNFSSSSTSPAAPSSTTLALPQSSKHDDGAWKWVARCFLACMKLTSSPNYSALSTRILADAASEFDKMVLAHDDMLLTAAQLVSSILVMHDQGAIARTVMDAARAVVDERLPEGDPIRILIVYLTVSTDGKIREAGITSDTIRACWEMLTARYGERHPHSVMAHYAYGWMLKFEGHAEQAVLELTAAYALACRVFGPKHMQSVFALASLAGAETLLGMRAEAIGHLEVVIRDAGLVLGISHPYTLEGKRRLATLLREDDEAAARREGGGEGEGDDELVVLPSGRVESLFWDVLVGRVKMLGRRHTYTEGAREDYEEICKERGVWKEREMEVRRLYGESKNRMETASGNVEEDIDSGSETASVHEAY